MKKLLYSSLAIAAMAVSCQEAELENNGAANNGEVFRIEVPISETKTVYTPPTKVTWATGDEITVIVNDTDANKFTNSEGNYFETTEFIPEAGTEYTYHAFYPYSSFVKSIDEAITVTFTVTSDSGKKTVTLTHRTAMSEPTELFISEYIEGSSSEKYIEIYNPTNNEINLDSYSVEC